MKKSLSLILLVFLCLKIVAQQEQRAFYIFRNDGAFNAFLFEEIDSISYSKLDEDSILCTDYVTQEIWANGYATRIPISAIDSICYQTPENVVKNDVVICSRELFSHIISADATSFCLDASTPKFLLPMPGQKFLIEEMSEFFPHALTATIDSIKDNQVYFTEISATDIFDCYYSVSTFGVLTENSRGRRTSKVDGSSRIERHMDLKPYEFTRTLDDIESHLKVSDEFSFGVGGNATINFRTEPHVDVIQVIQNGEKFVDTHVDTRFTATVDVKIYGFIDHTVEWDLIDKGWTIPIPYCPLFEVYVTFTPFVSLTANAALDFSRKITYVKHYHHSYSTNENLKDFCSTTVEPQQDSDDEYTQAFTGEAEIKIGAALEGGIRVKEVKKEKESLFDLDRYYMLRLYARGDMGLRLGAKVPFSKYTYKKYKDKGSEIYDALREEASISANFFAGFEWGLKWQVLHWEGKWAHDRHVWTLGNPFKKSLFPYFDNIEILNEENSTQPIIIKCGIKEDPLMPTYVGFKIVDEDNNELCTISKEDKYENGNFGTYELPLPPNVLSANKKCVVFPFFTFMDCEIKASPSVELKIPLIPYTDDVTDITKNSAHIAGHLEGKALYVKDIEVGFFFGKNTHPMEDGKMLKAIMNGDQTFGCDLEELDTNEEYYYCAYIKSGQAYLYGDVLKFKTSIPVEIVNVNVTSVTYETDAFEYNNTKYDFKYNCSTDVALTDNTDVEDWGYVYIDPDGSETEISLAGFNRDRIRDPRYAYCRNEASSTIQMKGYMVCKGDKRKYYGEVQEFPIEYPDSSSIQMTDCTFEGTMQDTIYNGQAYKYLSTFKFYYKTTGAYWLKVGTEEDNTTNSGWKNWNNDLLHETMQPYDGENILTVNYYYNEKKFSDTYRVYLKGKDETHEKSCYSKEYVIYTYEDNHFIDCIFHQAPFDNNRAIRKVGITDKEKRIPHETIINMTYY